LAYGSPEWLFSISIFVHVYEFTADVFIIGCIRGKVLSSVIFSYQDIYEHNDMTTHNLTFAQIIILEPDLAEVIINHGVELNEDMVDEYHDFLRSHLQAPFSLLINKVNEYSYNFAAQKKLAVIPEIHCMAVVAYKQSTERVTSLLSIIPREQEWNIKIFPDRDSALNMLREAQSCVRNNEL
jgi:hypothetical protein